MLERFDKTTGEFEPADPAEFMTEADAHSAEIEDRIERIETPAAAAGRRLAKLTRTLPPGFYAVVSSTSTTRSGGPAVTERGVHEGMRLLVSEHELPSPSREDRLALGRFAGLMYQRAPKLEDSIMRFGVEYDRFAQLALDRLMPGMRTGLATELARRRSRIPGLATDIGERLASSNWWVLRPEAGEAFVLGDSPVAATMSLGHDDEWRAILSSETYLVAMPIGPTLAILIAPQRVIPLSGIEPTLTSVTKAVNQLMWRHADRSVLARRRSHLEAVWPNSDDGRRFEGVSIPHDVDFIANGAVREVTRIVVETTMRRSWLKENQYWQRWMSCRLELGFQPWPAEDRQLFIGPREHGSGPPADTRTVGRIRRAYRTRP